MTEYNRAVAGGQETLLLSSEELAVQKLNAAPSFPGMTSVSST